MDEPKTRSCGPDQEELAGPKEKPQRGLRWIPEAHVKSPASPMVNKISFRELDKFRRRLSRWEPGGLFSPGPWSRDHGYRLECAEKPRPDTHTMGPGQITPRTSLRQQHRGGAGVPRAQKKSRSARGRAGFAVIPE